MYTEEQAKAKWCPFIREMTNIPDVAAVESPKKCVASDCMAWRWCLTKEPLSDGQKHTAGMAYGLAVALQPTTYVRGYCGLSGQASGSPELKATAEDAA